MGIFSGFLDDRDVRLVGVEAAGEGLDRATTAPRSAPARPACCTAASATCCRTPTARCRRHIRSRPDSTIPGVGPEHSYLRDSGRVAYESATDAEALDAFQSLCRLEGIIPALETAHALAWVTPHRRGSGRDDALVLVCLSGRGDKDVAHVAALLGHTA